EEVQAFIDQGVGQLHGFWYFEAERSFRQAAALDPDCAIAYWGMAMANVNNNKRAKQFIAEALKRKDAAQVHESLWIDALADFYDVKGPIAEESKPKNTKKKTEAELRKQLIKRLEGIIYDYPDDIEAKAFLGGFIWASREKGLPITSHVAVDALLNDVLAVEPMHPAHHYRIHLWDDENSSQALNSAALCGPAAPAIAHMWHMPGHTYTKLHRYHDAAWQQEAASRVDHAYMIRNHVIPDQIHNYAHNQEWLIRTLAICGRVHDATRLAKDMIELPRHPRYNTLGKSGTSATFGRTRLVDLLVRFELWDELLSLADAAYLEPSDNRQEQAKRCRALGAACFATGAAERGEAQIDELEKLLAAAIDEGKKGSKKSSTTSDEGKDKEDASSEESKSSEEKPDEKESKTKRSSSKKSQVVIAIEQPLEELRGRQSLAQGDATAAIAHFEKAKVGKELLSRAYLEAGNPEKAETFARQATDAAQGQVYPLANLVDVLHRLEKPDAAANALGRLRAASATLDMDLPIIQRITPVAEENHLPAD
ncbi:MAG TPA: alkyl hydroperoxide reductase, partial [Pirellulales bacterium]|nr:alkyl hydroperoxide reductase [Pirellulales bacterium]